MRKVEDDEFWESVADDALPEFFVDWQNINHKEVDELERLLVEGRSERALQTFLQCTPVIIAQMLHGGHARWVIPQKRLGDKYVTDFVIGERHSLGHFWYPVELESPTLKLFTKAGDPSAALTHAIRQIQDWRAWIDQNLDYARRDRKAGGLELRQIKADSPAIIFIGRRSMLTPSTQLLRERMSQDLKIEIHTFDHLLDVARGWCNTNLNSSSAP